MLSQLRNPLSKGGLEDQRLTVLQGHLIVLPFLTMSGRNPTESAQIYNGIVENFEQMYTAHRKDIAPFVAAARLQPDERALDLGTGLGWVARAAAQQCRHVIGIDNAVRLVAKARQLHLSAAAPAGMTFELGNIIDRDELNAAIRRAAHTLQLTTNPTSGPALRFNVIFLCWTMNELPSAERAPFLRTLTSFLLPGGRIVFDYQSPDLEMATVEVCYSITPINTGVTPTQDQTLTTAYGHYVGDEASFQKAQGAARTLIDQTNLTLVDSSTALPIAPWSSPPNPFYIDYRADIQALAQQTTSS